MQELYEGLDWSTDPRRPGTTAARSRATPAGYLVDASGEVSVEARTFLPGREKGAAPADVSIGSFDSLELAMLACEWHDFRYARAAAKTGGTKLVFVGSEKTATIAAELAAESAKDGELEDPGLIDMLVQDRICPNGRPFRRLASYLEAKKTAFKQNSDSGGTWTLSLSIDRGETPLWLSEAAIGSRVLLGAVPIGGPDEEDAWTKRGGEAFTRAHVLPSDPHFQQWLGSRYDRWGLVASSLSRDSDEIEIAVLETLKRLCGIARRRDLKIDRDAVVRLEKLDREYYRDMSAGFGMRVPVID
jgi:hypothetical protein